MITAMVRIGLIVLAGLVAAVAMPARADPAPGSGDAAKVAHIRLTEVIETPLGNRLFRLEGADARRVVVKQQWVREGRIETVGTQGFGAMAGRFTGLVETGAYVEVQPQLVAKVPDTTLQAVAAFRSADARKASTGELEGRTSVQFPSFGRVGDPVRAAAEANLASGGTHLLEVLTIMDDQYVKPAAAVPLQLDALVERTRKEKCQFWVVSLAWEPQAPAAGAERAPELQLPSPDASTKARPKLSPLVIEIARDGTVHIDGAVLGQNALHKRLREVARESPDRRIRIDAHRETPFRHVVFVLDLCEYEALKILGLRARE